MLAPQNHCLAPSQPPARLVPPSSSAATRREVKRHYCEWRMNKPLIQGSAATAKSALLAHLGGAESTCACTSPQAMRWVATPAPLGVGVFALVDGRLSADYFWRSRQCAAVGELQPGLRCRTLVPSLLIWERRRSNLLIFDICVGPYPALRPTPAEADPYSSGQVPAVRSIGPPP
jgi:hypothetical protein